MKPEVKNFVEKYNKRMAWNRDILSKMNIVISKFTDKKLIRFIDENLSDDDITPEEFDLDTAKVYAYEDTGTLEMQVFNNKTYCVSYFWCKPNENEDEYKKNRMSYIIKELENDIEKKKSEIEKLNTELTETTVFFNKIFKANKEY